MNRKIVVYVAGPYRSKSNWVIAQNIRRAEALSLEVWRAGMVAISPHLNTEHFQYELPDEVWLDGDLEMLRRCDAVLLVKGWEKSEGTLAEIRFAESLGLPVFLNIGSLCSARTRLEKTVAFEGLK